MSKTVPFVIASLAAVVLTTVPVSTFAAASKVNAHQAEHSTACGCTNGASPAPKKEAGTTTTTAEELQRIWSSP